MPAPVALQLYTLRDAIQDDFEGVIRQVAEIGYLGVEPYEGLPVAPNEAASLFQELGLEVTSAHLPLPFDENAETVLQAAEAYGLKRVVLPYLPEADFETLDAIKRTCETLNQANEVLQTNGYALAYHNHWWEFKLVGGQYSHEILLSELDPSILFELDVYWIETGGMDPVALIKAFGERAPLLHIKDGPADKPESDMVAVGKGVIDTPAVITAAESSADWLIVELDRCRTDMMTAVAESYAYLTGEGLARGRAG